MFTANIGAGIAGNLVSIIDLANSNNITNVPLAPGGDFPSAIAFDAVGQRVFTANGASNSISIIDLANSNSVINIPLGLDAVRPSAIAFDEAGQRIFRVNIESDTVSIVELPTVANICQNSGFETGDIRTFVSGQQTLEQITCVNFVGQCSGEIEDGETRECTVQDYAVNINEISNGDGIGILGNINESQQKLFNDP